MNSASLTGSVWRAIEGDASALTALHFTGEGALPSIYAVTDLASSTIGAACLAVADLVHQRTGARPNVVVDRRLSSLWFGLSIRPINWSLPAPWDPIAGDYRASDGWIRLHTNAPHHRAAAEHVLGVQQKEALAAIVTQWPKADLERAIVDAGGCAAQMRSVAQWSAHPSGRAIASEPLVLFDQAEQGPLRDWPISPTRPLAGIRVLDLTRVLAGPVASRFLAGYGANVLRVDPPHWNEPGIVPEVTLGKRCARLDLKDVDDRARFEALLRDADVLLHGYRADALDRLGYDPTTRSRLNPGLVDVSLNAYGWSGPWRDRRGFDSLVQMSAGIADAGMRWKGNERPTPLPVQALDHATGYLMATAAVRGIARRLGTLQGTRARLSLARTAKLLIDQGDQSATSALPREAPADQASTVERTPWGEARRLHPPASIEGAPMHWDSPATELGSAAPRWR